MTLVCDTQADSMVVSLTGELNALSSQALKSMLAEALAAGTHSFVIDLSGVSFIDSSGLGALVGGLKQAKLAGGNVVLAGLTPRTGAIFEITMADRIFDIVTTATEGLALLSR